MQDIAQETFLRAYRALPQFRGEAQFYTWLYRIAVNTAKKFLMDMRRDPVLTESALAPAQDDDETFRNRHEPSTDETPETVLAAQEIAAAVQEAMAALPEELRQAVTLREIEGLSYDEIAQAMACRLARCALGFFALARRFLHGSNRCWSAKRASAGNRGCGLSANSR